jgi:ankyrin repeat protein
MNIQEADGSTALMLAAKNKQKKAIKTLIAAGAQYNDTLPNYAEYQAFAAQIKEFFACAVDLSIPYYASSTGPNLKPDTLRRINELIKTHKLSLDYIDPQGNTLLHYAVLSGNRVAVSLMLYLMMKHNQCYALDHRARQSHMTPIQIAVTSRAAHLLHPFFNLQLPNKS